VVKARWKLSFSELGFGLGDDGGCFLKSSIISIYKISHSIEACIVYSYLPGAHFYQVEKYLHKSLFRQEHSEAERVNRDTLVLTSLLLQCSVTTVAFIAFFTF